MEKRKSDNNDKTLPDTNKVGQELSGDKCLEELEPPFYDDITPYLRVASTTP